VETAGSRLAALIARLAERPERTVVGLSSGTSRDGIDAALVGVSGGRADLSVAVLGFRCFPYPPSLSSRLERAHEARTPELARLDAAVAESFAAAALELLSELGRTTDGVTCIGSHGQTVFHEPPTPGHRGTTLQIGDLDIIAHRTGILTVGDFRRADVAAGGSGAPLVPLVDWLLFRSPGAVRLLLNLGGMANITRVVDSLDDVVAFDTGPGNTLSDEIVRLSSGGARRYDPGGAGALSGTPDRRAAERFLSAYEYFDAAPPKSTGKELFGAEAARRLSDMVLGRRDIEELSESETRNLLATAARIVGLSIGRAVEALPDTPSASEMLVSGGGVRNAAIMAAIEDACAGLTVRALGEIGVDPDAKEAVAFAVLAHETVFGRPGNVPGATGAGRPVVLGKISPAL